MKHAETVNQFFALEVLKGLLKKGLRTLERRRIYTSHTHTLTHKRKNAQLTIPKLLPNHPT